MSADREAGVLRSLALAMTLQFAVGGAVVPFFSILLRDRGLDFRQISQIYVTASAALMVFPFLWGMLADRYLPLNRVFTLVNSLAFLALLFLSGQEAFPGLLLCVTGFIVCFHPTLMLINPICFRHLRRPREQFGRLRAWGSLGWILPSLPIFLWLALQSSKNLQVALNLGMSLAAGMVVMSFWLPHTPPGAARSSVGTATPPLGYWPAMKRLLRHGSYVTILVSYFLMSGSFSILNYYSPPHLEQLGLDRSWIGLVQGIGVVLEIVLFRWRTLFVHRWSYTVTFCIGCLALMLRQLLFVWVDNLWILAASYLLTGMVVVFFYIGASLLANTIAGAEVRATAQTLLVLCGSGLGPMFANWIVGSLSGGSTQNLRPAFLFAAALAGLAALLILLRGPRLDRDAHAQG